MFTLAPGELARIRKSDRERKVAQADEPSEAESRPAGTAKELCSPTVDEGGKPHAGALPAGKPVAVSAAAPTFREGDILLIDVVIGPPAVATAIFDACGTASVCALRLTCVSLASLAALLRRRDELRSLPRDSGVARLFVLHNERASEREADHYGEWRAGWEPSPEEGEARCTFVYAARRLHDMPSDEEQEEVKGGEAGESIGNRIGLSIGEAPVAQGLAAFARWRGCALSHFANLRHLDLVLDEGQYRGSGTFLAQWIPDDGHGADERMVLVPTQGLDGSLLPGAALSAVAMYGGAYYERAGYHSAIFVEADLTAAGTILSGATKNALEMRDAMAWWRRCQPGPEYRLFCDIRHAQALLCPPHARETTPLARLRWELLQEEEEQTTREELQKQQARTEAVVAAEWEQWLPPSVVAESLEDERARLQLSIATLSSERDTDTHNGANAEEQQRASLTADLEALTCRIAELAATPAVPLPATLDVRRSPELSTGEGAGRREGRGRRCLPASEYGIGFSCSSPQSFTQQALLRDPALRDFRRSSRCGVDNNNDAILTRLPSPSSSGGGDVMTPRLGFHWQNNGVGGLHNNRGTTLGQVTADVN